MLVTGDLIPKVGWRERRTNTEGKLPDLEAAVADALQILAAGFAGTGMAPGIVIDRTAISCRRCKASSHRYFIQIFHRRLRVLPAKAKASSRMFAKC